MIIEICSVNDKNGLDRVYMLLNSIKLTKQDDTIIHYRLILEDLDEEMKEYFKDLQSEDFVIEYISTDWFKQRIIPAYKTYFYYVRCLFPIYFSNLDKLLYFDTDIILLKDGIQQLWEKDVTNYSLAAVSDVMVNSFQPLIKQQKQQTKTQNYFNSGVLIMNLKRIRETKKSEQLAKWCVEWDENILSIKTQDQTLLNYLFREDDVLYLDYKFNDFSLVLTNTVLKDVREYMKKNLGYDQPVNSVKDAVVLHFLGSNKPWKKEFEVLKKYSPYGEALEKIWDYLKKSLRKIEKKQ